MASDVGMMVGRAQEWLGKLRGDPQLAARPAAAY
jgi:hypothetical protein